MPALEPDLLNDFQRDFPLCPRPFAEIAARLGATEDEVIAGFRALIDDGRASRIGGVVRTGTLGASTLAAMAVPAERLDEVAALVGAYPEVNHNYEREHRLNLWFVVTAPDADRVAQVLDEISRRSGLSVHDLPMLDAYFLDLGFDLR